MKTAVLISGNGSNLQVLIDRAAVDLPIDICAVISSKADAFGLQRAQRAGIPAWVLSPADYPSRDACDAALAERIEQSGAELIVLAGFMRVLTPGFVQRFQGRILNIHPSLLPRYRGLNPHRQVLENGDSKHGASVHFVTEELDGGPVVMQQSLSVHADETEPELATRVQSIEHAIYPEAIRLFASGRLAMRNGKAWLDGKELTIPPGIEKP